MDTDQKLRRLLSDAADSFDPPSLGNDRQNFWKRLWERDFARFIAAGVVGVLVLVGLGLAFANGRDGASKGASSTSTSAAPSAAAAGGASSADAASPKSAPASAAAGSFAGGVSAGGTRTGSGVPAASSRVVQTGQLALEVARGQVSPVLARLTTIADAAGGYVSQSSANDTQLVPSGTAALRVPVASFDAVTSQVRKLGKVTSASTQSRDVTGQYVDLGARITALQRERDAFYTLLTKAATIGDTLAVQEQITPVQTQLEQLQGQQKVLADSSDLATVTVSVMQSGKPPVPVAKPASTGGFGNALRHTGHAFNTGLQAVIKALGPILLVLLILGIVAALGLLGRRVYRVLASRGA